MISLAMPFSGLPAWAETLFYIAFLLIVLIWLWTLLLFVLSRRALRSAPDPDEEARDTFLWVFLVPALNEEVTIADSARTISSRTGSPTVRRMLARSSSEAEGCRISRTGMAQRSLG